MIDRAELMRDIRRLVEHQGVRSADRANLRTFLHHMKAGKLLSYQDQLNLWAYLDRYRAYLR
ncbi:MAG: hypothetical protein M3Z66_08710 [Chloroflexota bacterium]|nr:hypothetical protein [Chloroflexota bacterium]